MIKTTTPDNKVITNTYNGEGKRIAKDVNGSTTRYLYEADKVVLELDGAGNQKAKNVHGTSLVSRTVDDLTGYYFYNGHGDVTVIQDVYGNQLATYYYDAFGNPETVQESVYGSVYNTYTYAGYMWDVETGLYYLMARFYDPVTARFLQEDTYRGNPEDILSLNLYTYCHNEPVMYTDPDGHKENLGDMYYIPQTGAYIDKKTGKRVGVNLRDIAQGAKMTYDNKTKTATVSMNGITKSYSGNIVNGKMQVDDNQFNKDFKLSNKSTNGNWSKEETKKYGNYKVGTDAPSNPDLKLKDTYATIPYSIENQDKAIKILTRAFATVDASKILNMPDAANNLEHYITGNGETLEIDYNKMTKQSSSARGHMIDEINKAMEAGEALGEKDKKINIVSINETGVGASYDSTNWTNAIGCYRTWGEGTVTQNGNTYSMNFTLNLRDRYDFHPTKGLEGGIVTDKEMKKLNDYGYAKEYEIVGQRNFQITWEKGERLSGWDKLVGVKDSIKK